MKSWLLTLLVAATYVLHQDYWNWQHYRPLILGFLPASLAYHAAYTVLVSGVMALLVKYAWPAHLDAADGPTAAVTDKN